MAKWIRENITDARVLLLTDRTELIEQIKGVFKGVDEEIYRAQKRQENCWLNLIKKINGCFVHWCINLEESADVGEPNFDEYISEIRKNLPRDFSAKGNLFVFVDECHRSHTGKLHDAMKELLPTQHLLVLPAHHFSRLINQTVLAHLGRIFILTNITRRLPIRWYWIYDTKLAELTKIYTSQDKIDEWFEERTQGLTDVAKAELKTTLGNDAEFTFFTITIRKSCF